MSAPTITAMVRAYNAQEFIGETVEAILAQTRAPDEVVVVDDGSTDATPEILAAFGSERVRVVRQPNSGLAAAFNRGFAESRGDYVAICDADDVWAPDRLERQAAALHAHPDVDLLFGAVSIFGTEAGSWGHFEIPEAGVLDGPRLRNDLFRLNVISTSTVTVRRALQQRVEPFAEHNGAEDYDFWQRCLRAGAVVHYDPAVLARYRRHADQVTTSMLRVQRAMLEVRLLHEDVPGDRAMVDDVLAANHFKIGRLLADASPREARAQFRAAARRAGPRTPTGLRARAWVAVLALPHAPRRALRRAAVGASRRLDAVRGGRPPALP
jgi:glycosyltransferase involved in cell wall biosynthesis